MSELEKVLKEAREFINCFEPDGTCGNPACLDDEGKSSSCEVCWAIKIVTKVIPLLAEPCIWDFDEYHGMWVTSCDHMYCTNDGGTLKQHGIKGCPFCIRPIKEPKDE